jgi:hypothetical protein
MIELGLENRDGELSYPGYHRLTLSPEDWIGRGPYGRRTWINRHLFEFPIFKIEMPPPETVPMDEWLGQQQGVTVIGFALTLPSGLRLASQLTQAVYLPVGGTFSFCEGCMTVMQTAGRPPCPEFFAAMEGTADPTAKKYCSNCPVCEGDWSLRRDPCPGCGALKVD